MRLLPEPRRAGLHTRIMVHTGSGTVSLSSFGGEGQGEEVVVFSQHARYIDETTHWKATPNPSIQNGNGPPLPIPLLQRRRGGTPGSMLASARCPCGVARTGIRT